jgi:PKD repeat protein
VAFDASASQPGTADKWTFVAGDNHCEPTSVETDPISSYKWDFGDGSPAQAAATPDASHTHAHAGTYAVTLTVTEANARAVRTPTASRTRSPTTSRSAIAFRPPRSPSRPR